jgi:hypothetical protein
MGSAALLTMILTVLVAQPNGDAVIRGVPPAGHGRATAPDCTDKDGWPVGMAFGALKNAGRLDNNSTDFSKITIKRLASEKIGKDLYGQVHWIRFVQKSGPPVEVVTVSDASHEECSESGVDVYVVGQYLPDLPGR